MRNHLNNNFLNSPSTALKSEGGKAALKENLDVASNYMAFM